MKMAKCVDNTTRKCHGWTLL